jgi:hypothetical protein
MAGDVKKMKPIWFFVGLVLLVMGLVVAATGVYDLIARVDPKTVGADLHPNIWWGGLMVLVGAIFVLTNRNATVE